MTTFGLRPWIISKEESIMYTTITEREIDELKISLLAEAKNKLTKALKDLDIEGLKIHERGGHGVKTKYNDRRMCYWISCEYEGREYWLTLFESDIDPDSGNCHTQYGKIMFVKDLVRNRSSVSSPKHHFIPSTKDTSPQETYWRQTMQPIRSQGHLSVS